MFLISTCNHITHKYTKILNATTTFQDIYVCFLLYFCEWYPVDVESPNSFTRANIFLFYFVVSCFIAPSLRTWVLNNILTSHNHFHTKNSTRMNESVCNVNKLINIIFAVFLRFIALVNHPLVVGSCKIININYSQIVSYECSQALYIFLNTFIGIIFILFFKKSLLQ